MLPDKIDRPASLGSRRARVRQDSSSAHLVPTTTGLAPSPKHPGLCEEPHGRMHIQNHSISLTEPRRCRRRVDIHHVDLSDEQKRVEGRYGRARVLTAEHMAHKRGRYDDAREQPLDHLSWEHCSLDLNAGPPTVAIKAEKTLATPYSREHNHALSTSVQISEEKLRKIIQDHPGYAAEAEEILRTCCGDVELVSLEEVLSRRITVEDFAIRSAEQRARERYSPPPRQGESVLGESSECLQTSTPFALGNSKRRADSSAALDERRGLSARRDPNIESTPVKPCVVSHDRHQHEGPAPFDSVLVSGEAYPSPPKVGVSEPWTQKPHLMHNDPNRSIEGDDVDTLAAKRACARRCASQSRERSELTVIGEALLTPPASTRVPAISKGSVHSTQSTQPVEKKTGRARVNQSHPPTALW